MELPTTELEQAANYHVDMQYPMGVERAYPIDDFKAGAEWMQQQLEPKWIDVEKELPENFRAVLVLADYIGTSHMAEINTVGCYQMDHWTTDRDDGYDKVEIHVRKWMYIPE